MLGEPQRSRVIPGGAGAGDARPGDPCRDVAPASPRPNAAHYAPDAAPCHHPADSCAPFSTPQQPPSYNPHQLLFPGNAGRDGDMREEPRLLVGWANVACDPGRSPSKGSRTTAWVRWTLVGAWANARCPGKRNGRGLTPCLADARAQPPFSISGRHGPRPRFSPNFSCNGQTGTGRGRTEGGPLSPLVGERYAEGDG